MHRKDDQYSPRSFLDTENDFQVYEIVSAQKSVARRVGRNSDQMQAGAISAARTWPTGRVSPACFDNKFYKSPYV
jgi:hypothetical protein